MAVGVCVFVTKTDSLPRAIISRKSYRKVIFYDSEGTNMMFLTYIPNFIPCMNFWKLVFVSLLCSLQIACLLDIVGS